MFLHPQMACSMLIFRRETFALSAERRLLVKLQTKCSCTEELERVAHMQCHDPLAGQDGNAMFAKDTRCEMCRPECWDLILGVPQGKLIRVCIWGSIDGPWTSSVGAFQIELLAMVIPSPSD